MRIGQSIPLTRMLPERGLMSAEQSFLQGLSNVVLMQVLVVRLGWFLDKDYNADLGPVSTQLG